uniref:Uncharacterized protein n=1 Tax=Pyxicephalus adspersus TaxID=30357 RepID=A0AAV2ZZV0_PYXAD|nr:TPA: hypothetical protein GDO54_002439 [Pyxicephalus adspersus]
MERMTRLSIVLPKEIVLGKDVFTAMLFTFPGPYLQVGDPWKMELYKSTKAFCTERRFQSEENKDKAG